VPLPPAPSADASVLVPGRADRHLHRRCRAVGGAIGQNLPLGIPPLPVHRHQGKQAAGRNAVRRDGRDSDASSRLDVLELEDGGRFSANVMAGSRVLGQINAVCRDNRLQPRQPVICQLALEEFLENLDRDVCGR
jgi:hypothetical protein